MAEIREVKNPLTDSLTGADVEENETEQKIYELGFHLVPTITAENTGAEFSRIKSLIEEKGGHFLSEELPKLRPLAYAISKTVHAVKQNHDKAYFSWIKFEAEPSVVAEIKKGVEGNESILRFIIVKTIKENTLYAPRSSYFRADPTRVARRNKEEKEKAEKPISEAELDKTIEELVVQ